MICPHCGRELKPAPPRLLTWGAPAALVGALIVVLLMQIGNVAPLEWARQGVNSSLQVVDNVAMTPVRSDASAMSVADNRLAPAVINPAGRGGDGGDGAAPNDSAGPAGANPAAVVAMTPTPSAMPLMTPSPEATTMPAPSATPVATHTPTSAPTATVTPTPTPSPSATPSATAIPTATATATRRSTATTAPSPTPPTLQESSPESYTVQSGDTIASIAARWGVTVAELLATNDMSAQDALNLRPGQTLKLPDGASATVEPTATPTPVEGATYVVQPGDTFVGIALRFSISTEELLKANGLSAQGARNLQVGTVLRIPGVTPASIPTTTPTPTIRRYTVRPGDTLIGIAARFNTTTRALMAANGLSESEARTIRPGEVLIVPYPGQVFPTPTPRSTPTPKPSPTPTAPGYRLDPPQLLNPADGVVVQCESSLPQYIQWERVPGAAADDVYVLYLGYLNGPSNQDEEPPIVWVLEQPLGDRTSWKMNSTYCNLAPQEYGRRWKWYVQMYANGEPISAPSATREFIWR